MIFHPLACWYPSGGCATALVIIGRFLGKCGESLGIWLLQHAIPSKWGRRYLILLLPPPKFYDEPWDPEARAAIRAVEELLSQQRANQ